LGEVTICADNLTGRSVPTADVLDAWTKAYEVHILGSGARTTTVNTDLVKYREAGKVAQDLRLDPRNFELSSALEAYLGTLSFAHRLIFEAFIFGRKVRSLDPSDANGIYAALLGLHAMLTCSEQTRTNRWQSLENIREDEQLGREWFFRFLKQNATAFAQASGSAKHRYLAGSLPPARPADVDEVNSEMASADGSRWIFERTIYQMPQGDFERRRIVHLFARVDQLDYV
jgi:hypothetical protein